MSELVSIFIPCRNEVRNIEDCISSMLKQDYEAIEIIVVDGMSTDGTREVLEKLSNEHSNVRFVDNEKQLTPYAFNIGVKNSKGRYIQISGSRNIMDPDYISKMVETLEGDPEIACVGGNYEHAYQSSMGEYISYAMESKFGVGASNYRTKKESCYVDTVGVPMYRREIFEEIGLFDENLTRNQDDDFNYRVTQKGHKMFYRHDTKVLYYVRDSLKKLFKQMSQYGYFKVFVNKKHQTVTTLRQLVPAAFVLYLVVGGALSLISESISELYIFILMIYFALSAYSASQFVKRPMQIYYVVLSVLYMHIGYGYGYLSGIRDFLFMNRPPRAAFQGQTTL